MKGKKFITKPIIYEFEIIDLSRPIPKEMESNFIEWLLRQHANCSTGKNHEHYSYTDDYKDDIGVTFYMKTKF